MSPMTSIVNYQMSKAQLDSLLDYLRRQPWEQRRDEIEVILHRVYVGSHMVRGCEHDDQG